MVRRTWPVLALLAVSQPLAAAEPLVPDAGPPPTDAHYLQYGVGPGPETVLSADDVCPHDPAQAPCILGSGLGLAIRTGYRARGPWYVGGAYEFARMDPANLLRLAILQQLRAEVRYYEDQGRRLTPYFVGGMGGVVYGSEWGADTGGVTAFLGAGLEYQLSRTAVVGFAATYRAVLLRGWTDSAGQRRADRYLGFGLAHLLGLEITLEIREPLARW